MERAERERDRHHDKAVRLLEQEHTQKQLNKEIEKRAIKIEKFEREQEKEQKELVHHRVQKREEKW